METLIYMTIAYTPKRKSWLRMATGSSFMRESVLLPDPSKAKKHSRLKYAVLEFTFGLWERRDRAGPGSLRGIINQKLGVCLSYNTHRLYVKEAWGWMQLSSISDFYWKRKRFLCPPALQCPCCGVKGILEKEYKLFQRRVYVIIVYNTCSKYEYLCYTLLLQSWYCEEWLIDVDSWTAEL